MEHWQSGQMRRLAKAVDLARGLGGSNPPCSANVGRVV